MGEFGSVCFQFTTDANPGGVRGFKKAGKYEFGGLSFDPKFNKDSFSIFRVNVYIFL